VPKIAFNDLAIRNLKAPEVGQSDYWDTKLAAFGCRVSQGGAKTFIVRKANRRIKLGRYPILSLQDARKAAHRHISEAHEPETGRKPPTLPEALETYYATHCASLRPGTVREIERLLKKLPALDQTAQEIYRFVDGIEAPSEKLHTFTAWKGFYIWAARRLYLSRSPMEGMKPPAQTEPFLVSQERRSAAKAAHAAKEGREAQRRAYDAFCSGLIKEVLPRLPLDEAREIEGLATRSATRFGGSARMIEDAKARIAMKRHPESIPTFEQWRLSQAA
jgi:hypothetical protein